ncbi:hypothetical protein SLEP1_g44201 [Rubroshorea leprosula]|uniref:Uncharacterized protein n=1 Tax=Rubroshorea leprosula TaxID=152421 RepID=A0AAV5LFG6_9ROSI|nr:hypothetical protein SLEP1_g44201 [Rubroshorea leprosula]
MAEPMETSPFPEPADLDFILSRIKELSGIHTCANEELPKTVPLESDGLLKDCAVRLERRVHQIIDE